MPSPREGETEKQAQARRDAANAQAREAGRAAKFRDAAKREADKVQAAQDEEARRKREDG